METYQVGRGDDQIKLAVDITTVGLAASRSIILTLGSSQPGKPVGSSENATGDISQRTIGAGSELAKKRLSVLTKIDLLDGNPQENKKEAERLTAKYILDNGVEGHKEFDQPKKVVSDDFSKVVLLQLIDLKP